MKSAFLLTTAFLLMLMTACTSSGSVDLEKEKQALMDIDRQFSKASVENGRNAAFAEYLADEGVMLTPNSLPVEGKQNIQENILSRPDSSYTLSWEPGFARVAASADLGYTYGLWTLEVPGMPDSLGNPFRSRGTYVTIWMKDTVGNWKWVLDTGNDGLGKK
jgi:ketosteroid isomerase-like protein